MIDTVSKVGLTEGINWNSIKSSSLNTSHDKGVQRIEPLEVILEHVGNLHCLLYTLY